MSGRADSLSLTPAANTNSLRSALYTEGTGSPTSPSTSAMPCSAVVTLSACSDETQMPRTAGDTPVTMERLLGLVKLGTTEAPIRLAPAAAVGARYGMAPAA